MASGSSSAADSGAHRLAARLEAAAVERIDDGVDRDLARLARGVESADTADGDDESRRREAARETLRRIERRLERAGAASNPGYWEFDSRLGRAWISPRLAELLDETPSNAPRVLAAIVAALRRSANLARRTEAPAEDERVVEAFALLPRPTGEPICCYLLALLEEDGVVVRGSARPLTERERADRFALAATHSTLSRICVVGGDGRILFVNRAWEENLRRKNADPKTAGVGANYLEVCARAAAGGDAVAAEAYVGISDVIEGRTDFFEMDYECSDDAECGWQYMAATPLDDGFSGAVLRHVDIGDRKRLELELERAAFYDGLTGLPNEERLRREVREAIRARGGDRFVALFRVGLDDLETIVEGYGHAAARAVESTIAGRLRSLDVERAALVGALGQAEFAVARIGSATDADCEEFANRLRTLATRPVALDGSETYYPRASVGVAPAAELADDDSSLRMQELFAQIALLRARSETGGGVRVFDERMSRERERIARLQTAARRALAERELELYFQPIVGSRCEYPAAVETLLRRRVEGGSVESMGEALSYLERSSTIVEIDEFVLGRACRQWRQWRDALGANWPVGLLSVNISPFHFQQREFADRLRRVLDETGMQPERLALEVTETAFVDDEAAFERSIRAATMLGVSIWVDDFGAGASSLALLRKGWASVVKLDRELAAPREYDSATVATIRAIARLARDLNVRTIAEGVETLEQAAKLANLGCDLQQGYLHARPMASKDFERWALKASAAPRQARPGIAPAAGGA